MANQQTAFGFRHVGYLSGSAVDYQMATRAIASTNTTAIFFGDPVVKVATTGNIAAATLTTSVIEGIFQGCMLIPPTGGAPTWSPFYPGSAAQTVTAYVINAPGALFLAAATNTAITAGAIGANIGFATGAGSTIGAGFSGYTLDQATATTGTTNTMPFQVVGIYGGSGNFGGVGNGTDATTPFNWAFVTFNNQRFKQLTGVL